jgi:hypothetical protein
MSKFDLETYKMKYSFTLFFIITCLLSKGQDSLNIKIFSELINFEILDSNRWHLISDNLPDSNNKGTLMYKHEPIKDSLNRTVEPIIAIVYELVNEKMDAIEYSVGIIGQKPFILNRKLLGGYPDYSDDPHSVVFETNYTRQGIKHNATIGYILCNNIGLEIIGDCTSDIYPKVEDEIKKFIKSVSVTDSK